MITTLAQVKLEKKISDSLFLISISLERYKEWIPGMFMQISLDVRSGSNYWLDSKAFSFASWGSPEARILVRREGSFTQELISRSEVGFLTSVRYPFGDFLLNSDSDKVFIAGGTGISVFLSYLDYITLSRKDDHNTLIFNSNKTAEENLSKVYDKEVPRGVSVKQFITDPKSDRYTGRMNVDIIRREVLEMKSKEFYVCGPPHFNMYWGEKLRELGLKFKVEQWINLSGDKVQ